MTGSHDFLKRKLYGLNNNDIGIPKKEILANCTMSTLDFQKRKFSKLLKQCKNSLVGNFGWHKQIM